MKIFSVLSRLFGSKQPPATLESLQEELRRVKYVIRFSYGKDLAKLQKEKEEIETEIEKLNGQASSDEHAVA